MVWFLLNEVEYNYNLKHSDFNAYLHVIRRGINMNENVPCLVFSTVFHDWVSLMQPTHLIQPKN